MDDCNWEWPTEQELFWLRSSVWFIEPHYVPVENPYPFSEIED